MFERDKINIGVLGAGGVGGSVLEHFYSSQPRLSEVAGVPISITQVLVRDLQKPRAVTLPEGVLTTSMDDVVGNPNINLVVSLLGDEDVERFAITRAMMQRKYVVTANKVVIAKYGPELFGIARQNGVGLMYEAAVGGGIQVIDNLIGRYSPNRFRSVQGILNGTTNFILTRMALDRMEYATALSLAQQEGLAEPDPTNDVEGHDAAYKLAILASLAFKKGWVDPRDIHREGISQIHPRDFKNAQDMGYVIKLIGLATDTEKGLEAWVAPTLLPKDHLLANINGALNGILLQGDPVGDIQLAGAGAGGKPTAASVWSDIVKASEFIQVGIPPQTHFPQYRAEVLAFDSSEHCNYIRMTITDGLGRVQSIGRICMDNLVSINQILQLRDRKWTENGVAMAEMAIDIDPSGEGNITQALMDLSATDFCVEIGSRFRMVS
ncbi:homoserine dehydrogenase [Candidatus Daviesbacteria bacterium]|nr:homoserine dehydrogenase [Candidatus Daviesbacteria bacterium]